MLYVTWDFFHKATALHNKGQRLEIYLIFKKAPGRGAETQQGPRYAKKPKLCLWASINTGSFLIYHFKMRGLLAATSNIKAYSWPL